MKIPYSNLAAIAFAIMAATSLSQEQYTDTTDKIELLNTATLSESYVNRTTGDLVQNSVGVGNNSTPASSASYEGHNVNIINNYRFERGAGVYTNGGSHINLTADEDTWNIITAKGTRSFGISITNTKSDSTVSRTKIYTETSNSRGIDFSSPFNSAELVLDNVEIHLGNTSNIAIYASVNASVTNSSKGGVLINYQGKASGNALYATRNSSIDLHSTTITNGNGTQLEASLGSTVSLTNSSIENSKGSTLMVGGTSSETATNYFNLNNVDLSLAKDQMIMNNGGITEISISNGTAFDGFANIAVDAGTIVNLDHSSWNVTRDSRLGTGSITLENYSVLFFNSTGTSGDFFEINTAAVMLATGSILHVDMDSSEIYDGQIITLFTGASGDEFTNYNSHLISSDGKILDYIDLDNGQFQLSGQFIDQVPEPASASLALLGLVALAFRRKNIA